VKQRRGNEKVGFDWSAGLNTSFLRRRTWYKTYRGEKIHIRFFAADGDSKSPFVIIRRSRLICGQTDGRQWRARPALLACDDVFRILSLMSIVSPFKRSFCLLILSLSLFAVYLLFQIASVSSWTTNRGEAQRSWRLSATKIHSIICGADIILEMALLLDSYRN
jgi:hypothetical protein